jgi:hypothetical protein
MLLDHAEHIAHTVIILIEKTTTTYRNESSSVEVFKTESIVHILYTLSPV